MSKETYVNKTDGLCECIICHYWNFLNINFKFQREGCNGCHDLMQKAMSFNYVVINTVKELVIEFIFYI